MQFSQRFSGHSKMYNTYHSRENQISIDGISTSLSYSIPYFPSFKMCLFVLDFTQGLNYKLLFLFLKTSVNQLIFCFTQTMICQKVKI